MITIAFLSHSLVKGVSQMAKGDGLVQDGANQHILNLITPSGLEISRSSLMIGENYGKCVTVTRYPTNPDYGWLSAITAIEGTTASIEFRPTDSGALIERCNEQIKQYNIDLNTTSEESEIQRKEKAIKDIRSMIKRINQDGEVVGYLNIMLLVQASSEKKLDERMKKVTSITSTFGCNTRNLTFLQKDAFQSIAPYGIPKEKLSDIGERNMPFSTFIGGFANASSGINDGIGYLLGKTDIRGKSVILNTWKRGGDRTNSNWLITGLPGVGKSATVKDIVIREFGLGTKIIFIDPEREYVDLVNNLHGDVINCGGGKRGKINPLQVRITPKLENDEEGEDFYEDKGNGMGDLALYFQTLRTFFKMYRRSITESQLAKLEETLEELYRNFNIVWDTDISKLNNNEFPIMEDLYKLIEEKAEESKDKDFEVLRYLLRSIAKGADSNLWNGYTEMESDAEIIDLDISALLEADEEVQKAQYYNILTWAWQKMSTNRNEKILLVVDEAYLLVDPEAPQALIFLRNVSKRIRKYEGGLLVITHSVVDLLDESVKRHGQAIIDNSCFKFIMGTDGKNLADTKKLFNLTEAEESLLLSKQRGKGILFAGSSRIALKIEIPPEFMKLMGNAGGR